MIDTTKIRENIKGAHNRLGVESTVAGLCDEVDTLAARLKGVEAERDAAFADAVVACADLRDRASEQVRQRVDAEVRAEKAEAERDEALRKVVRLVAAARPFQDDNLVRGDDECHGGDPTWLSRMLALRVALADTSESAARFVDLDSEEFRNWYALSLLVAVYGGDPMRLDAVREAADKTVEDFKVVRAKAGKP
jgi:hypothetical protein